MYSVKVTVVSPIEMSTYLLDLSYINYINIGAPGFLGHPNSNHHRQGSGAAAGGGPGNHQSERIELTYRRLVVRTPFSRQTKITVVAETTSRMPEQNSGRKTSCRVPSRDSGNQI